MFRPLIWTARSLSTWYIYNVIVSWLWAYPREHVPCGLRGCKNRAHSVSWPEVVKAIPNQGLVCFVSYDSFFCFSFVFLVYVVFCFIVFGCQYQCNWLPGKTRLRNDLLCVEWDVKPHTLAHPKGALPQFPWKHFLLGNIFCFYVVLHCPVPIRCC